MKKAYVAPKVIVHGKVEEITQGGRLPPPPWNWGGHHGDRDHQEGHGS